MMDGLSIRWKILGMSLGLAVGFIGLLSVAIFALNTTNQGLTQIQSIYYPVLVDARANTEALDRMAEGFNTAVTIGEADALEAMNPVYKAINERFNDQAKRLPEQAQDINQLKEQFARYYASASLLAKELIAGTADMSKVPERATANSLALEQLKKGLALFQEQSENSFTSLVEEADQRTGRTLTIIWIAGAILLVVVFSGAREFNSEVQHPPNQATCRSSSNTIWGCLKSKHLRGLRLSRRSKADNSSGLSWLRSLPLGTYCRNKPLLFSFRPRSHALYGCAK